MPCAPSYDFRHAKSAKKNRDLSGFDLINEAPKPTSFVVGNELKMKPRLTILTHR
jgi:hypothetical protein